MPHLIDSIYDYKILDGQAAILKAHRFIVESAKASLGDLRRFPTESWGQEVKRDKVLLPREGRPSLVKNAAEEHSFAEIVNQCANVERLLDALDWAQTHLREFKTIKVCHPTTGSSKRVQEEHSSTIADNDLILVDDEGCEARFEISDVASDRDGNRKERKDLRSLGVFTDLKGLHYGKDWHPARLFLVCSAELSDSLMRRTRHGLQPGHLEYVRMMQGTTAIIEVLRGPNWSQREH